ncbi:caspase-3-like [Diadema antillarum]|uniref:caspase-3-like n=1 Tax=Diadema antillarum TaxID=105358 RepID=UPI003A843887
MVKDSNDEIGQIYHSHIFYSDFRRKDRVENDHKNNYKWGSHRCRRKKRYELLDETMDQSEFSSTEAVDIFPHTDGLYKQKITPAEPTGEQLDPKENYSMNLRDKGMAFILNNNDFVDRGKRNGSEVDVKNVTHVFKEIGYEIVVKQDLTADEIRDALASLKTEIRSFHTSAVLVFMSHGDREGICGKDGSVISVEEIKEIFSGRNCPDLRGKPKIFFFQACRGDKMTTSAADKPVQPIPRTGRSITSGTGSFNPVDIGDESGKRVDDGAYAACQSSGNPHPVEFDNVPDNAHMFIAHATCEGYVALRDNVNGSWFIQALCEELLAGAHLYDLSTIMNKVSGRVQRQRGCVKQEKGTVITLYQTTQTISQGTVYEEDILLAQVSTLHTRSSLPVHEGGD